MEETEFDETLQWHCAVAVAVPKIMNVSLSLVELCKITKVSFLRYGILRATQEYVIAVLADFLFILHNILLNLNILLRAS